MGVQERFGAGIFNIAVNTGPLNNQVLLEVGSHLLYPDMKRLANDWEKIMMAFAEITIENE